MNRTEEMIFDFFFYSCSSVWVCNASWVLSSKRMEFTRFFHRGHWVSYKFIYIDWNRAYCTVYSFVNSLLHFTRSNRALSAVLQNMMPEGILDVKALRAFRVLRPLRLVSGVPSTYTMSPFAPH